MCIVLRLYDPFGTGNGIFIGAHYDIFIFYPHDLVDIGSDNIEPVLNEQSISIEGKNYNRVQWISNGKIIAEGEKIDLIAASQNIGCYVRAQLLGKGGICLTQAFVLDDGNMHEVTLRNITPKQRKLERAEDKFKSTRFYVLGQEISREIAYRKRRRQEKKK